MIFKRFLLKFLSPNTAFPLSGVSYDSCLLLLLKSNDSINPILTFTIRGMQKTKLSQMLFPSSIYIYIYDNIHEVIVVQQMPLQLLRDNLKFFKSLI